MASSSASLSARLHDVHLNADLHCHSTISDGTLAPEDVARRAHSKGVELWALTDHDELKGLPAARRVAAELGMGFLNGVEISVTFADKTVHIVGLGVDDADERLVEGLLSARGGRGERAREMADALARLGIEGTYEGALKYVDNPELISRTHFARYLVEIGVCADMHEVFHRYLGDGKPAFVPHRWARLGDAVRWIRESGGVAVIAHPARYDYSPTEEYALFSEFKAHGGQGVEVTVGAHTAAEVVKYADMAREFDLLGSRGSDFHSPGESRTELGSLPPLPGQVTPVWEALADRIIWPSHDSDTRLPKSGAIGEA